MLRYWSRRQHAAAPSIVVVVLAASTLVAAVIATQAIVAARQRTAISAATLRQYAELAAWEFSRQARRDIDQSLQMALNQYAHPSERSECSCEKFDPVAIEKWIVVSPGGDSRAVDGDLEPPVNAVLSTASMSRPTRGGDSVRILPMPGDESRIIAMKAEPHLAGGSGQIAFVAHVKALAPLLTRAHQHAPLLPAVLVRDRDVRTLVDLRVTDGTGAILFASPGTARGPYEVTTPLWSDSGVPLVIHAAMAPPFITALGPGHGAGPSVTLVVTLVGVNALLVVIGLWQLRRERELARLRADFVAGVSHELRTPLAQIRMFSETLLLDRVRNGDERRRALQIIGQESTRLSQLVDNVLHFHRRGARHALPHSEIVDLNAFVPEVMESFAPLAASKRARLDFTSTGDDVIVRGDTGSLRQVLLNVLDNAVKFGPAGQTIAVRVSETEDHAVLTIDDAGPGVPAADRERVFNAFERGAETGGVGGAGIGLAVVRQVVLAHRGRVTLDDAPTGGMRVVIAIPRERQDEHPAGTTSSR